MGQALLFRMYLSFDFLLLRQIGIVFSFFCQADHREQEFWDTLL